MNVRESVTIRAPSGKDEACVKFTIDTPETPFVLHEIAQIGQEYTLSFYAKSEASGGITAGEVSMDTSSEWQRYVVTFLAESDDVPLYFNATGTYYIHKIQLEEGNKDTTWALAPDDEEERLTDAITRITANESAIELMVSTQEAFAGRLVTTESQLSVLQENIDLRVKYTDLDAYSTTAQMEAAINVSASSITQTVSETYATKENLTSTETRITQLADEIELKVAKDGVIGAINLSSEEVKINATKITLEGATIADNFTATNLTVTGSSTFSGTLNGATGTFTGDVTATNLIATQSGRIGGFDIGSKYLANNTTSLCATDNSVYIGTDGISCGNRFKVTPDGVARLYCSTDSSGAATQDASFIVQNSAGTVYTTLTPDNVIVCNVGSYATIGCGGMAFVTGNSSLWYQIDSSNLFYSGRYVTNSHCGSWLNGATGAVAAIRIDQVGDSSGANWLASIRSPAGAWAMGVYNYESDGTFCLTYISDDLITASTNSFTSYTRVRPDGQIIASNSITVGRSESNESQFNAYNSLRNGRFVVSSNGILGIYDTTNSQWLLSSDSTKNVVLRGNTIVRLVASDYAVQFGAGFTSGTVSFTPRSTSGGAADAKIVLGSSSSRWTTCFAKNGTSTSSDERDKNISCLDKRYKDLFMKIEPIIYTWNDENDNIKHIGIGAQSFERAAYECGLSTEEVGAIRHDYWTEPNENGRTDRYSVNYDEVAMLAVPFVQDHEYRLSDTETKIEILQYRLDQAYDEIAKLKQQLAS